MRDSWSFALTTIASHCHAAQDLVLPSRSARAWKAVQSYYIAQWAHIWEATQVELHGHYTIANLQAFERYHATTSWMRALLVCVLTPLPCVAVIVGIDLLPLEPPALGATKSPHVWIRTLVAVTLITYCMLQQFKRHLPQLDLKHWIMVIISLAASTSSVAFCYGMALVIGYPLPFHTIVGMPAWGTAVVTMVLFFRGRTLVSSRRLARRLRQYLLVFVCQMTMTVVYPVFNYIYSTLSSSQQTGAILLLPIIKISAKNWISRTLPDTDDAKPEAVVFNVEIFHALFVSICMGSTSSPRTVAALMVIDFIQAWLSFTDLLGVVSDLSPISAKLTRARKRFGSKEMTLRTPRLRGLLGMCNRVIECEPFQPRRGTQSLRPAKLQILQAVKAVSTTNHVAPTPTLELAVQAILGRLKTPIRSIVVSPQQLSLPPDLATLNIVERGVLVTQTQQLLFITEFVVLVEYTEVVMPVIYSVYVVATWHLSNRAYYPNLYGITCVQDLTPTIANIQLYAMLEFASLVVMTCVVWWKLRLSLLHQLAFVLETRFVNVQAKILLWVLHTMQTSVIHFGADYSFRFAWLHTNS